jgi:uncharacterized protein (TIRG00374 family)
MSDTNRSKRIKTILTLVTLAALLLTAYMLQDQLVETFDNLREANKWPLLLVAPLAALNHFFQGKLYQSLFRILGNRFRSKAMMRLSLELNLVNNVFPSAGVSGFSYLSLRMKGEGVSTGKATIVQAMRFAMIFVSFQILLVVGLIMLAIGGQANDFVLLVAGSLATLMLVGTIGAIYLVSDKQRLDAFFTWLTKALNRILQVVRPKHPETINVERARRVFTDIHANYRNLRQNVPALRGPLLYALSATLTEIAAIYAVFIAFGSYVNPGAVIIAYAVANFAGLVSVLPGGVGIYEFLMTGVFAAAGVPASLSLPVTVSYRVLSMMVQLPTGYYFYNRALHYNPPLEQEVRHH